MNIKTLLCAFAVVGLCGAGFIGPVYADAPTITVHADQAGVALSPMFYGLMIEEINHSLDGGIYAELIRNRIFKDNADNPVHWSVVQDGGSGAIGLDEGDPVNTALTTCLKLSIAAAGNGQRVGVANDGFWGIPVWPKTQYQVSFYAKAEDGFTGPLIVDIESSDGAKIYATGTVSQVSGDWKQYKLTLQTGDVPASADNRFVIAGSHAGTVLLNLVSLFPPTYDNRPNGNRIDLMEKLAAMHPVFLRLPGGNYLEGNRIANRFDWKKTIGPLDQRAGHMGTWGYRSSDGMGLLEFLEWCQDLHMEPLLAVWAGYTLNHTHIDAGPALQPYVQDALDEIEYVTGGADTKWGAERARDGHPAPFPLHYVEIGNEDFFDHSGSYDDRFAQFFNAIKAKYPNLQIIATRRDVKSVRPEIVDEHYYYPNGANMEAQANHYDSYSRGGPKIFVGEWATNGGRPTTNMDSALGDAAWMTGMERNADVVVMESYAPLLINVIGHPGGWGLIGYDDLDSFGCPSYYVQSMFAGDHGDRSLPVDVRIPASSAPAPVPQGAVGVGTRKTQAEFKDISVTQGANTLYQSNFANGASEWDKKRGVWAVQDGALAQTGKAKNSIAVTGDPGWTDYIYSLKALKTGGDGSILVLFHVRDGKNLVTWSIGDGPSGAAQLQSLSDGVSKDFGPSAHVALVTGAWYDIRIEVEGRSIRCFLNGQLIEEATDAPRPPLPSIFSSATRDTASGDIIVRVVNIEATALPVTIDLKGVSQVEPKATGQVLSGDLEDVNSISDPTKIVPRAVTLTDAAPTFTYQAPAHSVSVLRFETK